MAEADWYDLVQVKLGQEFSAVAGSYYLETGAAKGFSETVKAAIPSGREILFKGNSGLIDQSRRSSSLSALSTRRNFFRHRKDRRIGGGGAQVDWPPLCHRPISAWWR